MEIGTLAQWAAVLVALVSAFVSWVKAAKAKESAKAADQARRDAEQSAQQSRETMAAAQEAMANAQQAMNTAQQKMADSDAQIAEHLAALRAITAESRDAPPWDVTLIKGMLYRLENLSAQPRYDVVVEAGIRTTDYREIGPRSAMQFEGTRVSGSDLTVSVSWSDSPGGPRRHWNGTLPVAPPQPA